MSTIPVERAPSVPPAVSAARCYHCDLPVPAGSRWRLRVADHERAFCCVGCRAAAAAILDLGLGDYYRFREAPAVRPERVEELTAASVVYDDPALRARYVEEDASGARTSLVLGGMTCSACAWLLEQRLAGLAGLHEFSVNFATRRAQLRWDPARLGLARILVAIAELGFEARPYTADARRAADAVEARGLLARLGVASIFGMQVMMIAFAFYFDAAAPTTEVGLWHYLRWVSLVLTLPVVCYAGTPFLRSAWAAVRAGDLNMDVPVSLAIVVAFGGSAWHTWQGSGDIWFDSVVMFIGFLLATRWLELRARVSAATRLESLATVVPDAACRIVGHGATERRETVPAMALAAGDVLWVRAGEVVAADGIIAAGASTLDESILTGEAMPQVREVGARVLAGSVNLESPLRITVTGVGRGSFAGHLAQLVERAAHARPRHDELGARVARWFVAAILVVAAATAWGWWLIEPARAWTATLAVLVVSCPCALAIARPAAVAAAHAALLAEGVAVLGAGALERLARVSHVVFDKTGTLTVGHLELAAVEVFGAREREVVLELARALAEGSDHPLARALRALPPGTGAVGVTDIVAQPGGGVRARVQGHVVVFGSRRFLAACLGYDAVEARASGIVDRGGKEAWLACDGDVVGRLEFSDRLRPEAPDVVAALMAGGLVCGLSSGDRAAVVTEIAQACGLVHAEAQQTPDAKLARVAHLQAAGGVVAMVGDGINDSAVMARADVSIAVADASAAARQQADILLLTPTLAGIVRAWQVARLLTRIVRQNLAWALAYNVLAVPLAVSGWLMPWSAALGMSLSSLLVVGNALRIRPRRD